jgi:uncharacterized membrane protein YhhN
MEENPYQSPLATEKPAHSLADDLSAFKRLFAKLLLSAFIGAFGVIGVILYAVSVGSLFASAGQGRAFLQVDIQAFLIGTASFIVAAVCYASLRRMK